MLSEPLLLQLLQAANRLHRGKAQPALPIPVRPGHSSPMVVPVLSPVVYAWLDALRGTRSLWQDSMFCVIVWVAIQAIVTVAVSTVTIAIPVTVAITVTITVTVTVAA